MQKTNTENSKIALQVRNVPKTSNCMGYSTKVPCSLTSGWIGQREPPAEGWKEGREQGQGAYNPSSLLPGSPEAGPAPSKVTALAEAASSTHCLLPSECPSPLLILEAWMQRQVCGLAPRHMVQTLSIPPAVVESPSLKGC